ncbi:MAG: PAS domain-containing protein [Myxococcota bacterium]|nr:PAS domain-containing protein [Myxococcota bacterium]
MRKAVDNTSSEGRPLHVVGIGASAGGLAALEQLFDHVPRESGMAYVVVQHLSPDFKSLMDELLARHTDLPIHLVEDGMQVEPDHVYLIPAKKEMIISDGRLLLSERERTQELTLPIDVFFRSLAQDCGPNAVAIVLSGSGSDGSRGVRDVHDAGGLVIVQDIDSAQFDGMPKTARDAGVASFVLAPGEMPAVLMEHVRTAGARSISERHPRSAPVPVGLDAVYQMLQDEFGIDFTHYKPSTVTRRIERRLQLARAQDVGDYVERLKRGREELDTLYRDLLIGVTRFFRNEEAFEALERKVLPELLRRGPSDAPFRVWVAGCATGEEAYSLAIVLAELSAKHGGRPIKIFATDVHPGSIEIAARATYGEESMTNVSRERLERYFIQRGDSYQVVPDIRQLVVFAAHNVIKDAPFTRMDLVSCRNMLIYLQPPAQQKVLSLFHFALSRGGVMFLGPSESPGSLVDDFEAVDRHWRIYRKYSDVRIPLDPRLQLAKIDARHVPIVATGARHSLSGLLSTYDTLLDEVMPPSLLVTERGELVHSFAGASRFLKLRDGRQDLDVLDVVDSELRMVLVGGLQRAKKETSAIVFKGVRIRVEGQDAYHQVTIRRVRGRSGGVAHLLISLEPIEGAPRIETPPTEIALDQVSRERLSSLEGELTYTKENLQAAIEELETSNEELQAANEELLASNEELQSTNEELQSVNEELYTVNAEYQRKIAELVELTNDMDNLLASTDVGAIFLDRELTIRKFTPQIAESFSLLPQDVGRSIETFTHKLEHAELNEDLRRVLTVGVPIERELRTKAGGAFFLRILPYRAKGNVEGVVLTLIDVGGLKAAEDALFHERYLLNSLLFSIPDAIYFKDARGRFIRANHAMATRLDLDDPRDAEGKTAFELPDQVAALAIHRQDEVVLRTGEPQKYRLEKRALEDGSEKWDLATRLPLVDKSKKTVGIIGVFRDVTEQKEAEARIHEAVRRRDEFLAMLSHELRNPLGAIVTATALLKSDGLEPERHPKLLDLIERQSKQMARLLDDLLEVGRVTQNKIELHTRPLDLRVVLREAADAVRTLMESREVGLSIDLGMTPLYVEGDPARLQQIQVNLLNNAAKYTQRGGSVQLEARAVDREAVVVVRDDGAGIPDHMLDRVFELFVQSERTLDRADGGLGVGLTLVRSLVEMHGGTVTVQSEGDGKGSEFVVRLPLLEGVIAIEPEDRPRAALGRGARVAVVEDNADSREMLCELLRHAGFECISADRGDAGLSMITETCPDVALVDVGLPGIDGFEVARRVRSNPLLSGVCLVALTGYGQPNDRARALGAGFDAHLVKPVDPQRLIALLATEPRPSERARVAQTARLHPRATE